MRFEERSNSEKGLKVAMWCFYFFIILMVWVSALVNFTGIWQSSQALPAMDEKSIWSDLMICFMYVLLGCIGLLAVLADITFEFGDFKTDIPLNVVTFDNVKWYDIPLGIVMFLVFLGLTYVMGMVMIGMPYGVAGTMAVGQTGKALYTASVAPIENTLASMVGATSAVFLMILLIGLFNPRGKSSGIGWIIVAGIGSLIAGWVMMTLHSAMYPATMQFATLATMIFFSTGTFVTLIRRSILPFDIAHLLYNFSVVMLYLVPMAVAII